MLIPRPNPRAPPGMPRGRIKTSNTAPIPTKPGEEALLPSPVLRTPEGDETGGAEGWWRWQGSWAVLVVEPGPGLTAVGTLG